jgi:DNA-binding SARP family transcriptional activator
MRPISEPERDLAHSTIRAYHRGTSDREVLSSPPPVRYTLITFGNLVLVRAEDGTAVGAPRRKPLALLALVAAQGPAGLARERAAALLWPEAESARARHTLAQTLYGLRRELGAAPVLPGDPLRLDPGVLSTDLERFQQAAAEGDADGAAEVYGGPFLDGVLYPGCGDFERWADRQRRRLGVEFVNLLAADARRASELGAPDVVVRWVRAQAAAPQDPDLALAAAGALADIGRPDDAARLLERHVTAVEREDPALPVDERVGAAIVSLRATAASAAGAVPAAPGAPASQGAPRTSSATPAIAVALAVLALAALLAFLLTR